MTARARVEEIDIIKALGILLMVLGHAGTPGTNWIYLFHMAVFVIASGYCFRPKHSETLLKGVLPFIGKRIWQLWVPYAIWQSVFVLLNNWLLKINVYTSNPLLFEYVNGSTLNNSTKANPCISADLFGDWREEFIVRSSTDPSMLTIFSTPVVTPHRLYTLLHDPQYRVSVAWQNVAYNQPPEPGYYIGPDSDDYLK